MPNSTSTAKPNTYPAHDQKGSDLTLSQLIKTAEQGDVKAQIRLGDCYFQGIGVKEDAKEGLKWYDRAAKQNKAVELCVQGYRFGNGIDSIKDEKLAFEHYRQSAEQGFSTAQYNLAYCYDYAIGTTRNERLAFEYYNKAAIQGFVPALNAVAYCLERGKGTAKDERRAFEYYQKAAEQGFATARNNLAHSYQHGIGTPKDEKKAFDEFKKVAEQGCGAAQYNLGICYEEGKGTQKDGQAAITCFHKAAKSGIRIARLKLRGLYCVNFFPKTMSESLIDEQANKFVTKYQLNYPQALALCAPDVQSWLLFGFQYIAIKDLNLIIFGYLCFLPIEEFRNDMAVINAKTSLEKEIFQHRKSYGLAINAYTTRASEFLKLCESLTTRLEDVKQLADKLSFWVKQHDEDSKQDLRPANFFRPKDIFYEICQRYHPFFQAAVAARAETSNATERTQNSTPQILPPPLDGPQYEGFKCYQLRNTLCPTYHQRLNQVLHHL